MSDEELKTLETVSFQLETIRGQIKDMGQLAANRKDTESESNCFDAASHITLALDALGQLY